MQNRGQHPENRLHAKIASVWPDFPACETQEKERERTTVAQD
jgi:hypothetical protein